MCVYACMLVSYVWMSMHVSVCLCVRGALDRYWELSKNTYDLRLGL